MDLVAQKSKIDAMITEARTFVGVRWQHRARSRFRIDCIGLVVLSLRAAGLEMRDRLDYGREPWNDGLQREMREHFGEPVDQMEAGDILTMRGIGQSAPGHVGIVAESNGALTVIHSYNADSNSRVVEHHIDALWLNRVDEIYRPFK